MRVIERPDSTTVVVETLFHLIRHETEAKNALSGVKEEDIIQFMRAIDPATFQPILYFIIKKEGKPISEWLKYCAPMELMQYKEEENG